MPKLPVNVNLVQKEELLSHNVTVSLDIMMTDPMKNAHHVDINVKLVTPQPIIVPSVNPTELENQIVIAQLVSMQLMKNQNVNIVISNV